MSLPPHASANASARIIHRLGTLRLMLVLPDSSGKRPPTRNPFFPVAAAAAPEYSRVGEALCRHFLSSKRNIFMSRRDWSACRRNSCIWFVAVVAGYAALPLGKQSAWAEPTPLPVELQYKVNRAINRGMVYLRVTQQSTGT